MDKVWHQFWPGDKAGFAIEELQFPARNTLKASLEVYLYVDVPDNWGDFSVLFKK